MPAAIDTTSVAQIIELLRQAKPLFDSPDPYLLAGIAIAGTVLGALATFFPTLWHEKLKRRELRRSVAAQLYAEIQATLQVERHRGYIEDIRGIVGKFDRGEIVSASFQVQISDDRFPIYRANIPHLALLDTELQTKVVTLYQLLEALIQDIKPGGLLNATEVGRKPFAELLDVLVNARGLADQVLAHIEAGYL